MAAQLPDMAATLTPGAQQPLPSLVSSRRLRWQKTARAMRLWVPAGILILLLFDVVGQPQARIEIQGTKRYGCNDDQKDGNHYGLGTCRSVCGLTKH